MFRMFLISFTFLFLCTTDLSSQENNYSKFNDLIIDKESGLNYPSKDPMSLFVFYKKYISSQDHKDCPYHPSCSSFSFIALKKYGKIKGIIMSLDRLSRCNRSQEYLYFLNKDQKMIDHP